MKYRKKPVVVDAIQYNGDNLDEIKNFAGESLEYSIIYKNEDTETLDIQIATLEGKMQVRKGDYIIKGVQGEFYPCKPDIFEQTYEMVDVVERKMVYFPFPIDCEKCPKAISSESCCEEMELLYDGKHPKYTKTQDWELMCEICPHEVTEREYHEGDEKSIGKTTFLIKEEAEKALKDGAYNVL